MDFSQALRVMKAGHRVFRAGWNGRGMFVWLVDMPIIMRATIPPMRVIEPEEEFQPYLKGAAIRLPPTMVMRTADGGDVAWLASQTDILAEDWEVLE